MKFVKKNQGTWLEPIKLTSYQGQFSTFYELAENVPVSDPKVIYHLENAKFVLIGVFFIG